MYSSIIVDVFNLFYRERNKTMGEGLPTPSVIDYANHLIDFIENTLRQYQDNEKPMYLLFDPIPLKDLGIDSSFKFKTTRQNISADYKANRKKEDESVLEVVELVRKYFSHRGEKYIECLNAKFEADDYVASIIKDIKSKSKVYSIALYTTDEDWARYLDDDVVIINKSIKEPMTVNSFFEKYKFIPTVSSVQMFKALFGDPSDNIQGVLLEKKIKRFNLAKKLGFEYVKKLGDERTPMVEVYKEISRDKVKSVVDKAKDIMTPDTEVSFLESIFCIDSKYDVTDALIKNLNLIESRCDDYKKYIVSKDVDDKYNVFINQVLGREKVKRPVRFGKVVIRNS